MAHEMNWRYDIESAKTLGRVMIALDNAEKWVGWSRWLPDENRWEMISTDQTPHAFMVIKSPLTVAPTLPKGMFS